MNSTVSPQTPQQPQQRQQDSSEERRFIHGRLGRVEYSQAIKAHPIRRHRQRCWRQRSLAALLLSCLLTTNALAAAPPTAPRMLAVSLSEFGQDIRFALASGNSLASYLFSWNPVVALIVKPKVKKKRQQQTPERVVIVPGDITVLQGETINFTAFGIGADGQPVHGVEFNWTVEDVDRRRPPRPLPAGNFSSKAPGTFVVAAETLGRRAQVTVTVEQDDSFLLKRALEKTEESRSANERALVADYLLRGALFTREISSRGAYVREAEEIIDRRLPVPYPSVIPLPSTTPPVIISESRLDAAIDGRLDGLLLRGPNTGNAENMEAAPPTTAVPVRPPDDDGWDGANWYTADDPVNKVGDPPGTAPADGASNGNFQLQLPAVSLPGRGLDVNLSLHYNSRVWSKSVSQMIYDADKGYPAPGWTLGFGKMVYLGHLAGCMLLEEDGARHSFAGTPSSWSTGANFTGYTTDGTMIDYGCTVNYGTSSSGWAKYANGTIVNYSAYGADNAQIAPVRITDAQGNYISITYVNNQGTSISTIIDTLGRVVNFNYDSAGRLISITGPGYNGATRTFVRLHYAQLSLSYAFASGMTTDTATDAPYVLDAVYYPDTNTGYWFGDSNSYSSYGMIAKVSARRSMSWSGTSGTQGTITSAGSMTNEKVYNFPMTANPSLTDAPGYSTLIEDWAGKDTGTATTTYNVTATGTTTGDEIITVTYPNGTKSRQTSHINSGVYNDGVYYKNEILDANNVVKGTTMTTMEAGDKGSFRPNLIETTDELNQTTKIDLDYATAPSYNRLLSRKEYNYANQLYRETRLTYETNANYVNRHIFNLVKTNEVYDASNNRLSRTEYEYDNAALVDTPNVVQYDRAYDPNTPEWCQNCGECLEYYNYECIFYEGAYVSNGDAIYKGNITKVTTYADAQSLTGAIAYDYTYDITGNQRTATTDCCQQMSFAYTTNTQYSQPESHTKGSSDIYSPHRMTESATYDFNTGAMTSATDFNNRTTTMTYDAVTRPTLTTLATGGKKTVSYDDANLSVTETIQLADNTIVGKTIVTYNGRGQARFSKYQAGTTNWNEVQTKYDAMGRTWQTSLPYDSTGSPSQWTTYTYDYLSRVTQTTAPDGSTQKSFYNETSRPDSASATAGQTVRSQDAWGRERWARTDAFGRLVEVVEPNPAGDGSVAYAGSLKTDYAYDQLDQLTQITQGSQTRSFKYDSLGRMTRQKLAEQAATINDAGTYVGTGGVWSDAFVYDSRSNITQRTDARGVKTNFSYLIGGNSDPLNRLQSISFDKTTADTTYPIYDAASVSLEYMTSGDKTRVWKVMTNGVSTEENTYDTEGRLSDYTLTVNSRSSYPLTTSYLYDTMNRLTEVRYPAQYGISGSPRRIVNAAYDEASRLKELKVNSSIQMNEIAYNTFSQATSIKVGAGTANPLIETYAFDSQTGLLTNQQVTRSGASLLDLSYYYNRGNSKGTLNGKTGNLTHVVNNLDRNKDRVYEHDALGRLIKAKGGAATGFVSVTANWTQDYSYDRYGNKLTTVANGITANSAAVPTDGLPSLSYDNSSNRINTSGYQYDKAGNLTKGEAADGSWQRYEYDAAGRLVYVRRDSDGWIQQANEYAATRERLASWSYASSDIIYYVWGGQNVIGEYTTQYGSGALTWRKNYVYAGSRLLSTQTANGTGGEVQEFHHPDRLGTKLITNGVSQYEQSTLPFGTFLGAESTGATNQVFTSYDRSTPANLDYAVNRSYTSGQSRFTSVDPIGMGATSIGNPQSNNLYAYVQNQPTDFVDPNGLLLDCGFRTVITTSCVEGAGCRIIGVETFFVCSETGGDTGRRFPWENPDTTGGGGTIDYNNITPKPGVDPHKGKCDALRRSINSHSKQAQRHLDMYGTDFSKWKSSNFPYNYLTGQLGDYQSHVNEMKRLTEEYEKNCNDQGPAPPSPAFADVPLSIPYRGNPNNPPIIRAPIPAPAPIPVPRPVPVPVPRGAPATPFPPIYIPPGFPCSTFPGLCATSVDA